VIVRSTIPAETYYTPCEGVSRSPIISPRPLILVVSHPMFNVRDHFGRRGHQLFQHDRFHLCLTPYFIFRSIPTRIGARRLIAPLRGVFSEYPPLASHRMDIRNGKNFAPESITFATSLKSVLCFGFSVKLVSL